VREEERWTRYLAVWRRIASAATRG
jgi:hypothetical protein